MIREAATEIFEEIRSVPYWAQFHLYAKRTQPFESRLRCFCVTSDRPNKTLERIQNYTQIARTKSIEVSI